MTKILLTMLLLASAISCTNSSSSSSSPDPAGKDGDKVIGQDSLAFGDKNTGSIPIDEPGKDLVLAVAYPLGAMRGQMRITELPTDLEQKIAKLPKPIDPKIQEQIDKVCFLSNTPHRWVIRRQNVDTNFGTGQVVDFDYDSVAYLAIETRTHAKCETLYYNFSSELLNSAGKPQPTPTPAPAAIPAGSESVVIASPQSPDSFSIVYDKAEGRNFTYKVSMLLDGNTFARGLALEKVFVNIFDKQSNSYVSDWTQIVNNSPAISVPAQYRLDFTMDKFSAPTFFIDRQKDMVLVFAVNAPDASPLPLRSLELDRYCSVSSRSFVEKSTGTTGCPK